MRFLVAENGAVIGIIVTDGIFWVQIGLVDGLKGLDFSHMRNLMAMNPDGFTVFWWIGNIGVKGAKKFKKCVGRSNSDSDEHVR